LPPSWHQTRRRVDALSSQPPFHKPNTSSSHDQSFVRGCVVCVLEGEKEDEERDACVPRASHESYFDEWHFSIVARTPPPTRPVLPSAPSNNTTCTRGATAMMTRQQPSPSHQTPSRHLSPRSLVMLVSPCPPTSVVMACHVFCVCACVCAMQHHVCHPNTTHDLILTVV
jgi:hypothetical protein